MDARCALAFCTPSAQMAMSYGSPSPDRRCRPSRREFLAAASGSLAWALTARKVSAEPETKKNDWGYGGDNGPDHWAELSDDYRQCAGEVPGQSPVPLSSAKAITLNDEETIDSPAYEVNSAKFLVKRKRDRGTFRFEPALRPPCMPIVGDAPPVDPWCVAAVQPIVFQLLGLFLIYSSLFARLASLVRLLFPQPQRSPCQEDRHTSSRSSISISRRVSTSWVSARRDTMVSSILFFAKWIRRPAGRTHHGFPRQPRRQELGLLSSRLGPHRVLLGHLLWMCPPRHRNRRSLLSP